MYASVSFACPFVFVALFVSFLPKLSYGGNCWSAMVRNNRCTELLAEKVSREECCSASSAVATAWSAEELDAGALFFWRVLGGGVPCVACRQSCAGVRCAAGQKCAVRRGRPRCVCAPACRRHQQPRGPVCGTDGRTYRTVCRLRKRACRRKSATLAIAYYGHCQSSCDKIRCPAGKHCLVDQNLKPHCVRCSRRCAAPPTSIGTAAALASRQVCGADGATYASACHLREAACRKGKAVPVAYKGRCKSSASCGSVTCRARQQCLSEIGTGAPRCVTCGQRCPRPRRREVDSPGPLCASNNRTYSSWCHMLRDACATGFVIETKHSGSCYLHHANTGVSLVSTNSNAVIESEEDGDVIEKS